VSNKRGRRGLAVDFNNFAALNNAVSLLAFGPFSVEEIVESISVVSFSATAGAGGVFGFLAAVFSSRPPTADADWLVNARVVTGSGAAVTAGNISIPSGSRTGAAAGGGFFCNLPLWCGGDHDQWWFGIRISELDSVDMRGCVVVQVIGG